VTDPAVEALAASALVLLVLFAWGVGEAVVLPIVPDVLLGWLALATPTALGWPMVSAIAGGVLGAVLLARLRATRPAVVERILRAQPGLGAAGMADARGRIERAGLLRAFVQLGPGWPLKAYVVGLVDRSPGVGAATVAGLACVNRLTRIVPVVAGFALAGVAARPLDVPTAPLTAAYAAGWTLFYAVYWFRRRSSASPRRPHDGL
jgi:hypothetical protein